MSTPANPDVYDWRWFPDSADVNSPGTALAALSTTYEVPDADLGVSHFLYAGIENDGDMQASNQFTLEYENTTQATGRVLVTTTSNHVRVIAGAEADATLITTPGQLGAGAGTWADGEYDDLNGQIDANVPAADYTNFAWSIEFRSADVNAGDSIDLYVMSSTNELDNDSGATINVTIGSAGAAEASGTPSIEALTASGIATTIKKADGTATLTALIALGSAGLLHDASGTPSIDALTASGVAVLAPLEASGSPSIEALTATGVATLIKTADGTPVLEVLTANGVASQILKPSGTPSLDALTASGVADAVGGVLAADGTPSLASLVAVGVAKTIKKASGSPLLEVLTASGIINHPPKVYLNTTQTLSGATEMVVTAFNAAGTSITFNDALGAPTGDIFLAVENRNNGDVSWIAVTVTTGGPLEASGTPSLTALVASGVAVQTLKPSGTPSLEPLTAAGIVNLLKRASGAATLAELTASGVASQILKPSGTPSIEALTASGVATLGSLEASGAPSIEALTALGVASQILKPSGTPSIDALIASGVATLGAAEASGTPSIEGLVSQPINIIRHSEDASDALWLKNGLTGVDVNVDTAPDGSMTMDRLDIDGSNVEHRITQQLPNPAPLGSTYRYAANVRDDGAGFCTLSLAETGEDFFSATFDLSDGSTSQTDTGTSDGVLDNSGSIDLGDGIFRLWIEGNCSIGGLNTLFAYIASSDVGTFTGNTIGLNVYAAVAGEDIIVGNIQAEEGPGSISSYEKITSTIRAKSRIIQIYKPSGTPTLEALTASGRAGLLRPASGTPSIEALTALGVASLQGAATAFGTPSLAVITASGVVTQTYKPFGTPSIEALVASGVATKGALGASGNPSIDEITAAGIARIIKRASGNPNIEGLTAAGVASQILKPSGAATLEALVASGIATKGPLLASGAPSIEALTASGIANTSGFTVASGAPSLEPLIASGVATRVLKASGTPSLDVLVASGTAILPFFFEATIEISCATYTIEIAGAPYTIDITLTDLGKYDIDIDAPLHT